MREGEDAAILNMVHSPDLVLMAAFFAVITGAATSGHELETEAAREIRHAIAETAACQEQHLGSLSST